MEPMLDATVLQTLWFALIAFFFLGYFVLEGFDFGVQMNVAAFWRRGVGTRKHRRRAKAPDPLALRRRDHGEPSRV
jgi:cytochrome bd-type quinol oxidase subunit 2